MAEISDNDIGKRVTVRLRDGAGFRDLVGHLESRNSIRNRHGELLNFDQAEIHLWKVIEEVARTASGGAPLSIRIYDLERIMAATWLPRESEELGGWVFRADIGITKRANSALVLNNHNHSDKLISWYRERNLNPTLVLFPEIQGELDEVLETKGFKKYLDVSVMVKDFEIQHSNLKDANFDFDYSVSDEPSESWLALQDDQKLKPLMMRSPAKYLSIFDRGELVAVGRAGLNQDWAVLSRLYVRPDHRGLGFGRKILSALEISANKPKVALQVSQDNQIAIQLYEKAGYQTHHFFRIRELPQQINLAQNCDC